MTDHHFIAPTFIAAKDFGRWLEEHEALWFGVLFTLLFVIFGVIMYNTFVQNDVFLLKSSILFNSADW
jgi:hypothetical protein